ncbi:MAG: hypothetical protein ACO1OQ_05875 [Rufibacter sp.]
MMQSSKGKYSLVALLVTFLVVKIFHTLVGFDYDIFREGILNLRFVADILSWAVGYVVVSQVIGKFKRTRHAQ